MANKTIQIGIDLGTTNSEICANIKGMPEIIKNIFGDDYTPSVFGIDRSGNNVVGKRAYEKLYKDTSQSNCANYKAEVKRLMGTSEKVHIERSDNSLLPEEISSEILLSLKQDVLRKYSSHYVDSVVITVPAYFSTLQAEATKRSGDIAGFKHVVLIQEPIAAAIAYGFMNTKNENWIVYDLGGGTFDVALVSSREGVLSVLGNEGDNFLGGKDFDWLIVDNYIVPEILKQFKLNDFNRGNPRYQSTFAKLKYYAEYAKVSLSNYDNTTIEIESIGNDEDGREIYLSLELSRHCFEELIRPFVDRTISMIHALVDNAGISLESVNKIVLVGGPTMIPYVRNRLELEFKAELDSSVDPLTVVSKGACIFAASQKVPDHILEDHPVDSDVKLLHLHYESMSSELEEFISGTIDNVDEGHCIQIQSESGAYSSDKIPVKDGKFFTPVALEPRKSNLFWIYLFNGKGEVVPVHPDTFNIVHGVSISGAPIPHSIGVALSKRDYANKSLVRQVYEPFFQKNSILPLKKTLSFHTVKSIQRGDAEKVLPIRIYEGESDIPNRNQLICEIIVTGEMVPFDLQENEDVEITIEVNESRVVTVEVFIPKADLHLKENVRTVYDDDMSMEALQEEAIVQKGRVKSISDNCTPEEKTELEKKYLEVESAINNSNIDDDERRKSYKIIRDLMKELDELEKRKSIEQLIKEFNEGISNLEGIINEYGNENERSDYNLQYNNLKSEGEKAIYSRDKHLLSRVVEQIKELYSKVWYSNPATWLYYLEDLANGSHEFTNQSEADYYIEKGRKAAQFEDIDELQRCVRSLMGLLPEEDQDMINKDISGITH